MSKLSVFLHSITGTPNPTPPPATPKASATIQTVMSAFELMKSTVDAAEPEVKEWLDTYVAANLGPLAVVAVPAANMALSEGVTLGEGAAKPIIDGVESAVKASVGEPIVDKIEASVQSILEKLGLIHDDVTASAGVTLNTATAVQNLSAAQQPADPEPAAAAAASAAKTK